MNCNCNKEKHSYHFDITEVVDGKIQEVMDCNFGVGLRLLHHALKKYPDNQLFQTFLGQLNDFKHALKGNACRK